MQIEVDMAPVFRIRNTSRYLCFNHAVQRALKEGDVIMTIEEEDDHPACEVCEREWFEKHTPAEMKRVLLTKAPPQTNPPESLQTVIIAGEEWYVCES
jgi:hypothetical protein